MLGKLFKHEMKETGKLLLPLDLILIAATCIAAFLVKMDFFMGTTLQIIPQIYMILYVLSIVALVVLTFIYLVIRYYKTMYSSQGYLTRGAPLSWGRFWRCWRGEAGLSPSRTWARVWRPFWCQEERILCI